MTHSKKVSPKGFTLIEILMVVFLIAVMATIALQSYTNSTKTFSFLAAYQNVMSTFQSARSNAISNRQQNGKTPDRYGVCVGSDVAVAFADVGDKSFKFDPTAADISSAGITNCLITGDTSPASTANGATFDTILVDKNFKINGYTVEAYKSDGLTKLTLPIFVYYEAGTGNFSAFDSKNISIKKSDEKFITVKISSGTSSKFLRVSQVSGLPEEVSGLQ